jgi:inositol-phosphate phosphatase / L-galactose 1-phosphate phosphatase / histidinol-phosphatase
MSLTETIEERLYHIDVKPFITDKDRSKMQETIAFLNNLADAAGAVCRQYFRKDFNLDDKMAHDPVTEADQAIETVLRALITKAFPNDGIYGEEFGKTEGSSGRIWTIDPIDGTRAFIIGRATFATLVSLCIDGKPMAGLIDQPIIGDRWIGAKDMPTLYNGAPCSTHPCESLQQARLILTSPDQFRTEDEMRFMNAALAQTRFSTYGGDCYAYGLLASGFADAMIEAHLKAHDIMPLVPIIQGAGGIITDWKGFVPDLSNLNGQTLACGDARVHQGLLTLL